MPAGVQRGGAESLFMLFLKHNAENLRDNALLIFMSPGDIPEFAISLGYKVRIIQVRRFRYIISTILVMWRIYEVLKTEKIDVVLTWMTLGHLYVSFPAYILGIPAIWYQHGISNKAALDQVATAFPAKLVICCSKAAEASQKNLFFKRATSVVYPAVDLDGINLSRTSKIQSRSILNIDWQGLIVMQVTRLEPYKGVHVFIEAAGKIIASRSDVLFIVVGGAHEYSPEYENQLNLAISEAKLEQKFLLVGRKPFSEIPYWLCAADIVVHPTVGPEPFGMVIIEAMALGRPVIASMIGGPLEIVENGIDGMLVQPNDPVFLANTIQALLNDPVVCLNLEANSSKKAESFSIEAMSEKIFSALREVSK